MQLRLRTKLTLVMSGLVLLVVAAVSGVYFALLLQQVLDQSEARTAEIARRTFDQVSVALEEAKAQGWRPESSAPEDIRDYVAYALSASQGLQAQLQAAMTIQREAIQHQIYTTVLTADQQAKAEQLRTQQISRINEHLQKMASGTEAAPAPEQ